MECKRKASIRAILLLSLFATFSVLAAPVGVLSEVSGKVTILRGEAFYEGTEGVEVEEQDIVETGDNASAQLDMNDGSVLKISGGSQVMLSDYELDDQGNVVDAAIDILSGWLRFAVSKLKGNGKYQFNTSVMTVGIRGTEGVIEAASNQGALQLIEGRVNVGGLGEAGQAPEVVNAGQHISRFQDQGFTRQNGMPVRFGARLPPRLKARLERRAHRLVRRGLNPRRIRRVMRRDVRRFLDNHPRMKQRLWRRFQDRWQNDPEFQDMAKMRPRQQPRNTPRAGKAVRKEVIRRKIIQRQIRRRP